jgi:NitT/TauT family transport system substrate-binding protein
MPLTRRAFARFVACASTPRRHAPQQLDKISFGTNWVAEAEHGGFYQAVADGTYRKHGLDVTIVPGGPQVNNRMLLLAGKIDFFMSANSLQGLRRGSAEYSDPRRRGSLPEGPQVLLAHPGAAEKFEDLKKLTLFVSSEGMQTYYKWDAGRVRLQREPGKALHPSIHSRFSSTRKARCRAMSPPSRSRSRRPASSLKSSCSPTRASTPYSTLIEARRDTVEKRPDLVQRFVNASAIGWYNYLYGDNKPRTR